ncbi:uncharacterized protein M8220_009348 isoform 1-T4 [Acridotheres tristis]
MGARKHLEAAEMEARRSSSCCPHPHMMQNSEGKRMPTPQKQRAACQGHSCRLGMKSAWRTCKIQSLLSSQWDVDVNVASFSEQLLRASIVPASSTRHKHAHAEHPPARGSQSTLQTSHLTY